MLMSSLIQQATLQSLIALEMLCRQHQVLKVPLVQDYLQKQNYKVSVVHEGSAMTAILRQSLFDLIIFSFNFFRINN